MEKPYQRYNAVLEFEGVFPCDEHGNPIMRWIGLKVINAGKERKLTKKEDQEQMKLLEQKRVLSIYPDLVRQFLKGKPEHWKDFAFTMYSMETGIQKKYWKYVTGLFEEKKDDNK